MYYTPSYESEEIRHLKKLPNSIITEQNLIEILNSDLRYLNLHNHTWINKEQINKIGYFATNIEELVLSSTDIDDDILIELGRSCRKYPFPPHPLVSSASTSARARTSPSAESGSSSSSRQTPSRDSSAPTTPPASQTTPSSHSPTPPTSRSSTSPSAPTSPPTSSSTSSKASASSKNSEWQVTISSYPSLAVAGLDSDLLIQIITRAKDSLESVDMSFIQTRDINDTVVSTLGMCRKLVTVTLTGSSNVGDSGISRLVSQGLSQLKTLKIGGLTNVSDSGVTNVVQNAPNIQMLELNNLERLQARSLEMIGKVVWSRINELVHSGDQHRAPEHDNGDRG